MVKEYVRYLRQGWHIRLVFGVVGAGLGFAYYTFIGCDGGCPITGNPWSSTAYGLFLGLLAYPGPKPGQQRDLTSDDETGKGRTS